MPPIFVDCTPSNGVHLLFSRTKVVGSGGFGESLWVGDYLKVLILSVMDVMYDERLSLKYSLRFIIFSSESFLL